MRTCLLKSLKQIESAENFIEKLKTVIALNKSKEFAIIASINSHTSIYNFYDKQPETDNETIEIHKNNTLLLLIGQVNNIVNSKL